MNYTFLGVFALIFGVPRTSVCMTHRMSWQAREPEEAVGGRVDRLNESRDQCQPSYAVLADHR